MLSHDNQTRLSVRARLLVAALVGLIVALLALRFVSLPHWGLFHSSQLSLFERIALLIDIFSPVLLFLIVGGGIWLVLSLWKGQASSIAPQHPPYMEKASQDAQIRRTRTAPTPSSSRQEAGPPTEQVFRSSPIAVPPLFQLENPAQADQFFRTYVYPSSSTPSTNPDGSGEQGVKHVEEKQEDKDTKGEETDDRNQQGIIAEQTLQERSPNEGLRAAAQALRELSPLPNQLSTPVSWLITISLLKTLRVELHGPDGSTWEVKLRGGENGLRLILLAYIASRRGEPVNRNKLFTHIIKWGRRRAKTPDQLNEIFDAAKKYLRDDLKQAVFAFNEENGQELISKEAVDFFQNESGEYWLHPSCCVLDLETIEQYHQTIHHARKDGLLDEKLDGTLPDGVLDACQRLIDAYSGDFLQDLLERFPEEFGPWVREPFTLYRDYYLDALWLMACSESARGRNFFDEQKTAAQNESQRRQQKAKAAQRFADYAMYALKSKWDKKLTFTYKAGSDGERVYAAEWAIRRCVVELGTLEETDRIDQVYDAFKEKMIILSEGTWKPLQETEVDVAEAKKQAMASRLSAQHPDQKLPEFYHVYETRQLSELPCFILLSEKPRYRR